MIIPVKTIVRFAMASLFLGLAALNLRAQATPPDAPNLNSLPTNSVLWVDDTYPSGAMPEAEGGDSWNWVTRNPAPFSGTAASQSTNTSGLHQVFFTGATTTLTVGTADVLFAYIYIDPNHLPTEVMLQWNDGSSWEHRAFWGANNISYGDLGTPSSFYAGPLPPAGQWTRLQVSASQVGLQGSTLTGMAFSLFDGRATWDAAGKAPGTVPPPPTDTTLPIVTMTAPANNTIISGSSVTLSADASDDVGVAGVQFKIDGADLGPERTTPPYTTTLDTTLLINGIHNLGAIARDAASNLGTSSVDVVVGNLVMPPSTNSDTVWFDDNVPDGAITNSDGGDSWTWVSGNPAPFSGTLAHQSSLSAGSHQHYFDYAWTTFTVNTGEVLVTYVYLDPVHPPSEIMLQWNDGSSWEHRAYWGANLDTYGVNGTVSRRSMGFLPPLGQWVRLEVPAQSVGLEGSTLTGMAFTLYNGQATWDYVGKRLVPKASIQAGPDGVTLSWPTAPGQTYRVVYKTELSQQGWFEASGPITATDSTTTWLDITTDFDQQRFYQIVQ